MHVDEEKIKLHGYIFKSFTSIKFNYKSIEKGPDIR